MPSMLDQFFALFLVVLFPLYNWNEARKAKRAIAGGMDPTKMDTAGDYKKGVAMLWGIGVAGVAIWLIQSRTWHALGLGGGSESAVRWAVGIAAALAGLAVMHWQVSLVANSEDARKQLGDQVGDLVFFLPKTPHEFYWFKWISFSAGVCEEIVYRGFLMWFIGSYLGVLPAVLLSAVAFGIAHSYQGLGNAAQTAIIGLWMAVLFWLTGALWIPMITHFLVDVIGGRMIYRVLARDVPAARGAQMPRAGAA